MICQLPLTNPYPGPRSVIVVDNCRIHHSEEIRELVEDDARKLPIPSFFNIANHLPRVQTSLPPPLLPRLQPN